MHRLLIGLVILVTVGCADGADGDGAAEIDETPVQTATRVETQTPGAPSPTTTETADPGPGEPAFVVDVVDGDTIDVLIDGREERVRLIGIDSPERGVCYEDEATAALEELALEEDVTLEADVENDRDPFGRLLRYVHLGEVFVNEELVRLGVAEATTRFPERAYREVLLAAEAEAKAEGRGLWSACPGLFE